jgi:hypothetical protein
METPTEKKPVKLRNRKQLRLTPQNELLASRLHLQYQLKESTTCDWTWFGNHLMQMGLQKLKHDMMRKPIPQARE